MEPERPIEKLLRAAAKKRREQLGEPMELRPFTREQLHREVASHVKDRRADAKSGGGFFSFFSGFTPRLAFGLGVLAIVVVGAWLLWPLVAGKPKPSTLAMNQFGAEKAPAEELRKTEPSAPQLESPAPTATPPPATLAPAAPAPVIAGNATRMGGAGGQAGPAEDRIRLKYKDTEHSTAQTDIAAAKQAAPAVSPPAGTMEAPPTSSALASADAVQFDDKRKALDAFGVATGVPNGATSVTTFAAAEPEAQKKLDGQNAPLNFTTNFVADMPASASQGFRRNLPAATPHSSGALGITPVLASFKMVQTGNQVRVVDADGSVYTGSLMTQPGNAAFAARQALTRAAPSAAPAAQLEGAAQSTANYYFRVTGTNRNLNQNVVFSGNLIPITNAFAFQTNAPAFGGAIQQQEQAKILPVLNARISGTAVIGNNKEIQVNANPVP